jgi:hypothetical protein
MPESSSRTTICLDVESTWAQEAFEMAIEYAHGPYAVESRTTRRKSVAKVITVFGGDRILFEIWGTPENVHVRQSY